jgi:hypothetical protein
MTITKKPLQNKGSNKYYGLMKPELCSLYQAGLIKSVAYVYLALKLENPWCDRPVSIDPKQFSLAWGIPQSTLYRAVAKLADRGLLKFDKNKLNVSWLEQSDHAPGIEHDDHSFSKVRNNSHKLEKILTSENFFPKVRINSQRLENQVPEPLPDKDLPSPHTIHTIHTDPPLDQEEEEKFLKVEKTSKPKVKPKPKSSSSKPKQKSVELPSDLLVRLEELGIDISQDLIEKISKYHLSQAYGALYHVESTIDSIDCAQAVFLYQLPKQPIEKLGDRLGQLQLNKAKEFEQSYLAQRNDPNFTHVSNQAFDSIKQILARSKLSFKRGDQVI